MIFQEEASWLVNYVMDYSDGTPEYDALIEKLLAHRDSQQDFTENDYRLIIVVADDYLRDTEEDVTPSYDSPPFSSPAVPDIVSQRDAIFLLRERLLQGLPELRTEL